jgi:hypothetical protein
VDQLVTHEAVAAAVRATPLHGMDEKLQKTPKIGPGIPCALIVFLPKLR